jgi:hypothetical protein
LGASVPPAAAACLLLLLLCEVLLLLLLLLMAVGRSSPCDSWLFIVAGCGVAGVGQRLQQATAAALMSASGGWSVKDSLVNSCSSDPCTPHINLHGMFPMLPGSIT